METKQKPKHIAMSPVKSGQIAELGHEGTTLAVKFKSGATYHYHNVSADTYGQMLKAASIGSFFGEHIKKKGILFTKLEGVK